MNTEYEYFNNKRKLKFFPILTLSKLKKTNEKKFTNNSLNSMSSSDFNSKSFSSKKLKYSQKNSYNNSDKSVTAYEALKKNLKQVNRIQQSSEALLKKSFFNNLSNIKKKNNNSNEKILHLFDDSNKNNILILNKGKSKSKNTYANKLNLFNTPLNKNIKLKYFYYKKKKMKPINKHNNTILKKFEGDFHNFYMNSLKKVKNDFVNKMNKINKTFYKSSNSKRENIDNIKNLKNSGINLNNYLSTEKNGNKNLYYINKNKNLVDDSYISKSSSKSKNVFENKLIKTKYSSQFLKVKENYKRKRNFKQYMDEKNIILEKKWKIKLDVIDISTKYDPLLIKDLKFQSGIIKDELCILLDDIQHFRFTFFEDKEIYSAFKNKSIKYQINLNQMIEETCALLHLIPKLILKDYYFYTDKFISITDPSKELFSKKIVYNETECFQDNLKYLYKILNFVNCCSEVYSQLVEQVEDEMIISLHNFDFLRKIFNKIRHYIINLTNICKNILKDYIFDKHIIAKFKDAIKKTSKYNKKENSKKTANNNKKNKIIKKEETNTYENNDVSNTNNNYIEYDDKYSNDEEEEEQEDNELINEKLNKKLKLGEKFISQKISRIAKALEGNKTPNKKEINKGNITFKEKIAQLATGASGPMALINSTLMLKMLKYIKKDYKQKIISIRTSERLMEKK